MYSDEETGASGKPSGKDKERAKTRGKKSVTFCCSFSQPETLVCLSNRDFDFALSPLQLAANYRSTLSPHSGILDPTRSSPC